MWIRWQKHLNDSICVVNIRNDIYNLWTNEECKRMHGCDPRKYCVTARWRRQNANRTKSFILAGNSAALGKKWTKLLQKKNRTEATTKYNIIRMKGAKRKKDELTLLEWASVKSILPFPFFGVPLCRAECSNARNRFFIRWICHLLYDFRFWFRMKIEKQKIS